MGKSNPDLSEFYKLAKPKRPPCHVGHAIERLSAPEVDQLAAACAVDSGIINTGAIVEWLKRRGHVVSVSRVTAHRKGTCSCHD